MWALLSFPNMPKNTVKVLFANETTCLSVFSINAISLLSKSLYSDFSMISVFQGILYMSCAILLFFCSINHKTCDIMQKELDERRKNRADN